MKIRLLLGLFVFAGASLALVQSAQSSDKKTAAKRDTQKKDAHAGHDHGDHDHDHAGHDHGEGGDDAAMMAEWMKMMAPGEHHDHLKAFLGNWNYALRWRMAPDGEWTESNGTAVGTSIMDGRYVMQKVEGMSMGMLFKGMSITGYDNIRKQYVATWIDNMATGIFMAKGTCDNSGKEFTFKGTIDEPMSGQMDMPIKEVLKIINENKHVFEWHQPGPDGKMYMSMEITYTRQ